MANNTEPAITLCVLLILGIILIILGPIVVSDYNDTKGYTKQICSGTHLNHLDINEGIIYSRGTVNTCVIPTSTNETCVYDVTLFYPPIDHWSLAGKKRSDVNNWAAGLGAAKSFVCYIEEPFVNGSRGISDFFNQIAGWIAMTVIATLVWTCIFCFILYICCDDIKDRIFGKKTDTSDDVFHLSV